MVLPKYMEQHLLQTSVRTTSQKIGNMGGARKKTTAKKGAENDKKKTKVGGAEVFKALKKLLKKMRCVMPVKN